MIKKTLAVLLALCIVVVAVPFVSASTADPTEANAAFAAKLNAAAGETVCVLSEDKTTVTMIKNATLSDTVSFANGKLDCEVKLDLAGYVIDGLVYCESEMKKKLTVLDSSAKKTGYLRTYGGVYASDGVAASLFCNEINIRAGETVCRLSDDGLTVIFDKDFNITSCLVWVDFKGAGFAIDLNGHRIDCVISISDGVNIVLKGSGSIRSVIVDGYSPLRDSSVLTIDSDSMITMDELSLYARNSVKVINGALAIQCSSDTYEDYIEAQAFLMSPVYGNTCTPAQELAKTHNAEYSYLFYTGVTEKINYCHNTSDDDETIALTVPLLPNQPLLEYMPKRDGYAFKGWYYSRKGNDPVGVDDKLSDGTTIYAQWLKIDDVQKESGDPTFNVDGNVSGFGLAGAQIRTIVNDNGKTGLRFVSRVSKQLLNDLEELGGKTPEYGHLLSTGVDLTDEYYNFSSPISAFSGVGDCKALNVYYDGENYNMFTAVVTNITRKYFSQEISARPYIKYTDANGLERVYYYTESESQYSVEKGGGGYIATLNGIAQYIWDNDRPAEGTKAYDYIYQVLNGEGEIVVDDEDYSV